jgi:hypothetical protein
MAITLNDNLKINAGKPVDSKYLNSSNQPYPNTAEVISTVAIAERYVGLTVLVNTEEYWFATGVTDVDLVVKTADVASAGGITGATNGLTKVGSEVALGGDLTGNTTINSTGSFTLTFEGQDVEYAADYSGSFTERSIVDAGYVTGITSLIETDVAENAADIVFISGAVDQNSADIAFISGNTIVAAANGLSLQGQTVVLGGTLTGDTTIDTANSHGLVIGTNGACVNANNAVAIGDNTYAGTNNSLVFGRNSCAYGTGSESLAGGYNSAACAAGSIAVGNNAVAGCYGSQSIAVGNNVTAYQYQSQAFGSNVYVSGQRAFGGGLGTVSYNILASGSVSFNFSENTASALGGAYADNSVILGGTDHTINSGAVRSVILGGNQIDLSGATYADHVAVPNLAIFSTPADDANGDILVWDSVTKKVGKTTLSAFGGLTGATNGLSVAGQDVKLGGSLTENTTVAGGTSYSLGFTDLTNSEHSVAGATALLDLNAKSNAQLTIKSQSGTLLGDDFTDAVGINLDYNADIFRIIDNRATPKGIEYAADYSANYTDRSLVDKEYVDAVASGLDVKDAAIVATTISDGNIDLTGGTFGGSIDGITVQDGWRVLVKNQTNAVQNGVYDYVASASTFIRSADFDGNPAGEVTSGSFLVVVTGDTLSNTVWAVTTPDPIVVDTTEINFSVISRQLQISAGDGIDIDIIGSTNQISVGLVTGTSALSFDGNGDLRVDPSIAGSGLTFTAGVIDVNASAAAITGTEIPVKFGTGNDLFIDSADVDSAVTPLTAGNGITLNGNAIDLGGALTANTSLTAAATYSLSLGESADRLSTFNVYSQDATGINAGGVVDITGTSVNINNTTGAGLISGNEMEYNADFSSAFTARSIPDVGYVTGLTSNIDADLAFVSGAVDQNTTNIATISANTINNAANGLTKVGDTVVLGGSLTGATVVETAGAGFSLGFGSSTFGLATSPIAMGYGTCAAQTAAMAINGGTAACGIASFAHGNQSTASGAASRAGGYFNVASGYYSWAEGQCNTAIGIASGSMGSCTSSSGDHSFAGGFGNSDTLRVTASGTSSFNFSENTVSQTSGHGALANNSVILGGTDHNIESGNVRSVILGGNGIKLTGSSYVDHVAVPNLAIFSTPADDSNGEILVWDSVTKKVGKTTLGNITGGTLANADNGLTKVGDTVILGGTLTGDTQVDTNGNIINFSNYAAVGTGAAAFGQYSCVNGNNSLALGGGKAYGNCNISIGYNNYTVASAYYATGVGYGSFVCGKYDTLIGAQSNTNRSGTGAGCYNTVVGSFSTVWEDSTGAVALGVFTDIGGSSQASANSATVVGYGAKGRVTYSTALGAGADAGVIVNPSTSGATAIGHNTAASARNSTAIGREANVAATAQFSVAIGFNNDINAALTGATLIGGYNRTVTDTALSNYVITSNLAIESTPDTGASTDAVLVWNSTDKKVKQLDASNLGEDNNTYAVTAITASTTLTPTEYVVVVDTSVSPQTVTLPASPNEGQAYKIKDNGNALSNQITIAGNGNNIDGASTASINTDFGALEVVYTSGEWYTLAFIN